MPLDLPPNPPVAAIVAQAPTTPECRYLSNAEAQTAFRRLKRALPGTAFDSAAPSEVCGLVRVRLSRGATAYTDATGRFFLLAFALDTHKGGPADTNQISQTIDNVLDKREQFPLNDGLPPLPFPNNTTQAIP